VITQCHIYLFINIASADKECGNFKHKQESTGKLAYLLPTSAGKSSYPVANPGHWHKMFTHRLLLPPSLCCVPLPKKAKPAPMLSPEPHPWMKTTEPVVPLLPLPPPHALPKLEQNYKDKNNLIKAILEHYPHPTCGKAWEQILAPTNGKPSSMITHLCCACVVSFAWLYIYKGPSFKP
jgi:hypothetical protein